MRIWFIQVFALQVVVSDGGWERGIWRPTRNEFAGSGILGCKEGLVAILSDNSGRKSLFSSFIGVIRGLRLMTCSHGCWFIVEIILELNKVA